MPGVFEEAIARCCKINTCNGDPMAGLKLDSQDLIRLAGAQFALIVEENLA